jgi:Ca-activated chloride channel family protein
LAETVLLEHIIRGRSKSKTAAKFLMALIIYTLLVLTYANFQIGGKLDKNIHSETIDLILAVDISHSMLTEDIKPNRLERAKMFCLKLSEKIKYTKTGIILFAGDAFIHMPITSDPGAVRMFINSISTDLISLQGTAIGKALQLSSEAFIRTEARNKAVILVSDGENFEDDAIEATGLAVKNNILIHTVSIGTPEGGSIPVKEKDKTVGFKKDNENNTVISKPDFVLLSEISKQTGGISVDGNQPGEAIDLLEKELSKLEKEKGEALKFSDWDTLFHLFALPALIILILDFLIIERKMKWQNVLDSILRVSLTQNKSKK